MAAPARSIPLPAAVAIVLTTALLTALPIPSRAAPALQRAAAACTVNQSGAAVPTPSSGRAAVRTTIGVAKTMGVPVKGQIVAVMASSWPRPAPLRPCTPTARTATPRTVADPETSAPTATTSDQSGSSSSESPAVTG